MPSNYIPLAKGARNMKKCKKCHKVKDESEFRKCSAKRDGLHCYCKDCHNEYAREWRKSQRGRVSQHTIIRKRKNEIAEQTYNRTYSDTDRHDYYKDYQRNYQKEWLSKPENKIAHKARCECGVVVNYLQGKAKYKRLLAERKQKIAKVIKYLAQDSKIKIDQLQVDHIIPLKHLVRFLMEKTDDKNKILTITNSQPNIGIIEKGKNKNKYDLVLDRSIDAAIHLEDAYEECSGLVDYLDKIKQIQELWGGSTSRLDTMEDRDELLQIIRRNKLGELK